MLIGYKQQMGHVRNANAYPSFRAPLTSSLHLLNGNATPTFGRTTTATVTDFEGIVNTAKIDEARFEGARRVENLLEYSEDFSNAIWVKGSNVNLTVNDTIAPDGTLTAEKYNLSAATSRGVDQDITANPANKTITFSCYFKAITDTSLQFQLRRDGISKHSTAIPITVSQGWQRLSFTATYDGTTGTTFGIRIFDDSGNIGDRFHFWGAQLEEAKGTQTEASEYVSSDVPVSQGEEEVINGGFDTDSDWFKGTGWTISGGAAISNTTSNAEVYQSGVGTLGTIYEVTYEVLSVSGEGYQLRGGLVNSTVRTTPGIYTEIITWNSADSNLYLRSIGTTAGSIGFISVKEEFFHGANVDGVKYFDIDRSGRSVENDLGDELITNGDFSDGINDWTTALVGGSTFTETDGVATLTRGTGTALAWQNILTNGKEYSVSIDVSAVNGDCRIINNSGGVLFSLSTAGVGTHTFTFTHSIVSGNFLIVSNTNGSTVSFTNISVKEVLYVRGLKGYLVEEQRTNLLKYSEDFSGAGWAQSACTIDTNATTAPDGTLTADTIIPDNGAAAGRPIQSVTTVAGKIYTSSVFIKQESTKYNKVRFLINPVVNTTAELLFNFDTGEIESTGGSPIATFSEEFNDGWYRISVTQEASGTNISTIVQPFGTGNGVDGIYAWGAQFEEDSSFASSYIKTEATTITRTADALSYGAEDIKQGEGSIVAEFNQLGIDTGYPRIISISDGTTSNRVTLLSSSIERAFWIVDSGGATQASFSTGDNAYNYNESNKIGISYKDDDVDGFLNGILEGSDTSATIPTNLNIIDIGQSATATSHLNGTIKNVNIFKRKIADSEMIRRTV